MFNQIIGLIAVTLCGFTLGAYFTEWLIKKTLKRDCPDEYAILKLKKPKMFD
jgi:hypothetical protein